MNRRQKKKAFKKKYGYNPPPRRTVNRGIVDTLISRIAPTIEPVFEAFKKLAEEAVRIAKETVEQVQTMPEEDFIKFLETPGMEESTKALAKQLRAAKFIKQHNGEGWETVWSREQKGEIE